MTSSYNCDVETERAEGLAHAHGAISAQQCVVLPTDTVYGIAADAFSGRAVAMLLAAKGRGRNMPPPVLVPRLATLAGLATDISADAQALAEKFWPGGLTLILVAQPSLLWDLGDTMGTVALRMPNDPVALELMALTGPLAVSSANRTGQPAAQTAAEARDYLAESVEVYLDDGVRPAGGRSTGGSSADSCPALPSTIVDATGDRLRVVRNGVLSLEALRAVVPGILGLREEPDDDDAASSNSARPAPGDSAEPSAPGGP